MAVDSVCTKSTAPPNNVAQVCPSFFASQGLAAGLLRLNMDLLHKLRSGGWGPNRCRRPNKGSPCKQQGTRRHEAKRGFSLRAKGRYIASARVPVFVASFVFALIVIKMPFLNDVYLPIPTKDIISWCCDDPAFDHDKTVSKSENGR